MSLSRKLALVSCGFVAAACAGLGIWQLDRLSDRRARNRIARQQLSEPEVDLNAGGLGGLESHRRAVVRGEYDFVREIVIRGRLLQGAPGVQIVTPLLVPNQDAAVLVNRGFVPTPDANFPAAGVQYSEPGSARVAGVVLAVPDAGDGQPIVFRGRETWHRLDLSAIRARLPYPVASFYLIAEADSSDGSDHTPRGRVLPIRIEVPTLTDGPHLSYAVQWFLIGAAAVGFGVAFAARGAVTRRRGGESMTDEQDK